MQKVFVMYKLKPGVSMDEYRKWSVELDQKVTPFQPGVHRFEVFEMKGAEKGDLPFDIVEDIEVESWEAWQQVLKSEAMKEVTETWNQYGDSSTLTALYGEKVNNYPSKGGS